MCTSQEQITHLIPLRAIALVKSSHELSKPLKHRIIYHMETDFTGLSAKIKGSRLKLSFLRSIPHMVIRPSAVWLDALIGVSVLASSLTGSCSEADTHGVRVV